MAAAAAAKAEGGAAAAAAAKPMPTGEGVSVSASSAASLLKYEQRLSRSVDDAFFELREEEQEEEGGNASGEREESAFRPLMHVLHVLEARLQHGGDTAAAAAVGGNAAAASDAAPSEDGARSDAAAREEGDGVSDAGGNAAAGGGGGEEGGTIQLHENERYLSLQEQLETVNMVVEQIVHEHHGALNNSVESMGFVLEQFSTANNTAIKLRENVRECKRFLTQGLTQQSIRQLWYRKLKALYYLDMLDKLEMLRDAPRTIDILVQEKRYLGAVQHLKQATDTLYHQDIMNVPALASLRIEVPNRQLKVSEAITDELRKIIFLHTTRMQLPDALEIKSLLGGGGMPGSSGSRRGSRPGSNCGGGGGAVGNGSARSFQQEFRGLESLMAGGRRAIGDDGSEMNASLDDGIGGSESGSSFDGTLSVVSRRTGATYTIAGGGGAGRRRRRSSATRSEINDDASVYSFGGGTFVSGFPGARCGRTARSVLSGRGAMTPGSADGGPGSQHGGDFRSFGGNVPINLWPVTFDEITAEAEASADQPDADPCVFLRLLIQAASLLRKTDDVEKLAMINFRSEVLRIATTLTARFSGITNTTVHDGDAEQQEGDESSSTSRGAGSPGARSRLARSLSMEGPTARRRTGADPTVEEKEQANNFVRFFSALLHAYGEVLQHYLYVAKLCSLKRREALRKTNKSQLSRKATQNFSDSEDEGGPGGDNSSDNGGDDDSGTNTDSGTGSGSDSSRSDNANSDDSRSDGDDDDDDAAMARQERSTNGRHSRSGSLLQAAARPLDPARVRITGQSAKMARDLWLHMQRFTVAILRKHVAEGALRQMGLLDQVEDDIGDAGHQTVGDVHNQQLQEQQKLAEERQKQLAEDHTGRQSHGFFSSWLHRGKNRASESASATGAAGAGGRASDIGTAGASPDLRASGAAAPSTPARRLSGVNTMQDLPMNVPPQFRTDSSYHGAGGDTDSPGTPSSKHMRDIPTMCRPSVYLAFRVYRSVTRMDAKVAGLMQCVGNKRKAAQNQARHGHTATDLLMRGIDSAAMAGTNDDDDEDDDEDDDDDDDDGADSDGLGGNDRGGDRLAGLPGSGAVLAKQEPSLLLISLKGFLADTVLPIVYSDVSDKMRQILSDSTAFDPPAAARYATTQGLLASSSSTSLVGGASSHSRHANDYHHAAQRSHHQHQPSHHGHLTQSPHKSAHDGDLEGGGSGPRRLTMNRAGMRTFDLLRPIFGYWYDLPEHGEQLATIVERALGDFSTRAKEVLATHLRGKLCYELVMPDSSQIMGEDEKLAKAAIRATQMHAALSQTRHVVHYRRHMYGGNASAKEYATQHLGAATTGAEGSAAGDIGVGRPTDRPTSGRFAHPMHARRTSGATRARSRSQTHGPGAALSSSSSSSSASSSGSAPLSEMETFTREHELLHEFWDHAGERHHRSGVQAAQGDSSAPNGFPVTAARTLLDTHSFAAIASLAYSCDRLAYNTTRLSAFLLRGLRKELSSVHAQQTGAGAAGLQGGRGNVPGTRRKLSAPSALNLGVGSSALNMSAPVQAQYEKQQQWLTSATERVKALVEAASTLSNVALDCILCLRLEVEMMCMYFAQQISSSRLDLSSRSQHPLHHSREFSASAIAAGAMPSAAAGTMGTPPGGFGATGSHSLVLPCIGELTKRLLHMQSILMHTGPRTMLTAVMSPVIILVPRLMAHSVNILEGGISPDGCARLNSSLASAQHHLVMLFESAGLPDHMHKELVSLMTNEFDKAKTYLSLLDLSHEQLESFIRAHRTDFKKEQFQAIWTTRGSHRVIHSDTAQQFLDFWSSLEPR